MTCDSIGSPLTITSITTNLPNHNIQNIVFDLKNNNTMIAVNGTYQKNYMRTNYFLMLEVVDEK